MDERVDNMKVPGKMRINRQDSQLEFARVWFNYSKIIFFVIIFSVFGFFLPYLKVFFEPSELLDLFTDDNLSLQLRIGLFFIISLLYFGIGYFSYRFLAILLNKTYIFVDRTQIMIKHGPIPWRGKSLNTTNLKCLDIKEKYFTTKGLKYYFRYDIRWMDKEGSVQSGISAMLESEEAEFIKLEIDNFLNLTDGKKEFENYDSVEFHKDNKRFAIVLVSVVLLVPLIAIFYFIS
jgi:hypothetical protein